MALPGTSGPCVKAAGTQPGWWSCCLGLACYTGPGLQGGTEAKSTVCLRGARHSPSSPTAAHAQGCTSAGRGNKIPEAVLHPLEKWPLQFLTGDASSLHIPVPGGPPKPPAFYVAKQQLLHKLRVKKHECLGGFLHFSVFHSNNKADS